MGSTRFGRFADLADAVGATTSKIGKRDLLAGYLGELPADDLGPVATWLAGSTVEASDARLGLGWVQAGDALRAASGATADALRAAWLRHSDFGDVAAELLAGRSSTGLTVAEVAAAFGAMARSRSAGQRTQLMSGLLGRASAAEARYVAKIAAGELRIGLREGLLEEAIAAGFGALPADVRRATMLVGQAGAAARLAQSGRLAEASLHVGRPIRLMLATPVADATEVIRRVGGEAWVEDKYDGIRAQLHRSDGTVRLFSRDLKDVTRAFPDVVAALGAGPDLLLDGELVPFRAGRVLDFADLQSRLGRVRPSDDLLERVPVVLVAFDLLHHDGRDLLELPLRDRRRELDELKLPDATGGAILYSRLERATSAEEIDALFDDARERHNEGLMIKGPESAYQPGRRGLGWLKLKKALATLDCVVVGVEWGHGKRRSVLSDYTFAVRDDRTGELLTIGKAYTGLTDAEIASMTEHFQRITGADFGRYRTVIPEVVVEIAFDRIMRSNRHASGFALRFPRIVRLRLDKGSADIDLLSTVEALFTAQASGRILLATGRRGQTARIAASGRGPTD